MLLGQDKRELGALVFPDEEYLAATGADNQVHTSSSSHDSSSSGGGGSSSSSSQGLEALLFKEVTKFNRSRPDFHSEDHIGHIQVMYICFLRSILDILLYYIISSHCFVL